MNTLQHRVSLRSKLLALLLAGFAFLTLLNPGYAQTPLDEQLSVAMSTLINLYGACTVSKFSECIQVEKTSDGRVRGTLTRTVNGGTESTDIRVSGKLTEQDAQAVFKIEEESYSKPPTDNVTPVEFWRYEKFSAGLSPVDDAVLQAWLAPNLDSTNGSGFGFLVCRNLIADFKISLYGSERDKALVDTTQRELKGLMQEIAKAFQGAGACNPNQSPTTPYAGPYPTLATISAVDNISVIVFPKGFGEEGRRFGKTGYELQWGDKFCFKGLGTLTLKWFDGSTISFNDPRTGKKRGMNSICLELTLTRPDDIPAPGVLPRAGQFVVDFVSNLGGAVRMVAHLATTPTEDESEGRFRVSSHTIIAAIKGTSFVMGEGTDGSGFMCVEEGVVEVTPRNSSLSPFDLTAGNQVSVTADAVGAITPGCTLPPDTPIAQPNLNVNGMTLQAAQKYAIKGETVLVPVWLIKSNNLANLNFEIDYDPAVIQPEGDLENYKGNLLDNALFKPNATLAGRILAGFAQTSGIQTDVGTMVEIPFRVLGNPGDVSPLLLNVTAINDPNGGVLNIDRIPGQVLVVNEDGSLPGDDNGGSGGTGTGTGNGTGGGSDNPGGIQTGDCDGSGILNELDALCALEMSVGLRQERNYVDMEKNGLPITSRDAVIILQRAVGQ